MADKLKITLRKSLSGCLPNQRKTIKSLGLGRTDSFVVRDDTPVIRGMINVVSHMVEVEEM